MNINDSNIRPELTFRRLVYLHMQQLTNFPYIEKDFDALTDYELLCLVVKYLNDVIDNSNEQNTSITNLYNAFLQLQTYMNNSVQELEDAWNDKTTELENAWSDKTTELETAFNNLQTWINNYFDNLDVQDEINNKLDQMLKDGVLEQIIEQFLHSTALWCFDTVQDMKNATNLVNGSFAKTLGYYSANDGGGATYKITNAQSQSVYQEELDSGLYATLIINDKLNVKQIGVIGNNNSNSAKLNSFISNYDKNIYFPTDYYYFTEPITMKPRISVYGDFPTDYELFNAYTTTSLHFLTSGFINCEKNTFKNLSIYGSDNTTEGVYGIARAGGNASSIDNCNIFNFYSGVYGNGKSVLVTNSIIKSCNIGILNCTDAKIINNTISSNVIGIKLTGQGDDVISENRIEWNQRYGIYSGYGWHLEISNNLLDRNGYQGIYVTNMKVVNIVGNLLRRNYASDTSVADEHCHIQADHCTNININSNVTDANVIDDIDPTSAVAPPIGLYFVYNKNINIVGNNFSGVTSKPYASDNYAQKCYIDDYTLSLQRANTGAIATGNNASVTFPIYYVPSANNYNIKYDISVVARNTNNNIFTNFDDKFYIYNNSVINNTITSNGISISLSLTDGVLTATVTNNTEYTQAIAVTIKPLCIPYTGSYTFYKNE